MRDATERAVSLLKREGATLAVVAGDEIVVSHERGVAPLLALLEGEDSGRWSGLCAADRVVGAAAAHLYALLGAAEVWAPVMSQQAVGVLEAAGISVVAETVVGGIVNRAGTGPCPMEAAVAGIEDSGEALAAIRAKRSELAQNTRRP
ncbi:DUF1893 domain-containing protein [Atopobiaceae bacterium 24-176]